MRILLAEDSALDARLFCSTLQALQPATECEVVEDGADALARLRSNSYDAVVLDDNLPSLSGLEILAALGTPVAQQLSITMLTGIQLPTFPQTASMLGARACWQKPADLDEYEQIVARIAASWQPG